MAMSEYIYYSKGTPLQDVSGEISLPRKEIIRCRDCENYEPSLYQHFTCELFRIWVEQDDFCAWGEKR